MANPSRIFEYTEGSGPLVIAAPHVGTVLPTDIADTMTPTGLSVNETDYHVHRLFDFAPDLNASTLWATHSRYVIDLNRDPAGLRLYPGKFETPLCPVSDFDFNPIYRPGHEPGPDEIARRLEIYYHPYHQQLTKMLTKTRNRHGYALLIDAHSIRPNIPSLFTGTLPTLNFGTNDGVTLPSFLLDIVREWQRRETDVSHVLDGRFKGGYTTRHYGRPSDNIHALQIEVVQDAYLDMSEPHVFKPHLATPLSRRLKPLVEALLSALKKAN